MKLFHFLKMSVVGMGALGGCSHSTPAEPSQPVPVAASRPLTPATNTPAVVSPAHAAVPPVSLPQNTTAQMPDHSQVTRYLEEIRLIHDTSNALRMKNDTATQTLTLHLQNAPNDAAKQQAFEIMMREYPPLTQDGVQTTRRQLERIAEVSIPPSCRSFHAAYTLAMRSLLDLNLEMSDAVKNCRPNSSAEELQAIMLRMDELTKNPAQTTQPLLTTADAELTTLCAQYGVMKPFTVHW